jgi:hypothetical protein
VTQPDTGQVADNPFSTRFIRPGAIAFRFPPDSSAEGLVERLRTLEWRGAILGPHGSGKSSLLAALIPAIRRSGKTVLLIELHDGQRRLPVALSERDDLTADSVVVVDGYEQLSCLARRRLGRFCRSRGTGLLVTSHHPVGLPELFHTNTSLALAEAIVTTLLAGRGDFVRSEEVAERFQAHAGNLRETLFDLYDLYEQRGSERRDGIL